MSISPSGEIMEGDSVTLNCSSDSTHLQKSAGLKEE